MSIQERVELVIKMHNLTPASFADTIGVQRSNISHILSGRNKPSLDMLEKIVLSFHRVNAHWLITGNMPENAIDFAAEEHKAETHIEVESSASSNQPKISVDGSEIEKIVTFYTDGTFTDHYPRD